MNHLFYKAVVLIDKKCLTFSKVSGLETSLVYGIHPKSTRNEKGMKHTLDPTKIVRPVYGLSSHIPWSLFKFVPRRNNPDIRDHLNQLPYPNCELANQKPCLLSLFSTISSHWPDILRYHRQFLNLAVFLHTLEMKITTEIQRNLKILHLLN